MLLHVQRRYYILYLILTFIYFIRISSLFARTFGIKFYIKKHWLNYVVAQAYRYRSHSFRIFDGPLRLSLGVDIARGMRYLHELTERPVIHRDLVQFLKSECPLKFYHLYLLRIRTTFFCTTMDELLLPTLASQGLQQNNKKKVWQSSQGLALFIYLILKLT